MQRDLFLALVLGLGFLPGRTAGLALMHDVDEAEYLELGRGFPAVVQVGGLASGTLVAPTWVLTVAHGPEMIARMRPESPLEVEIGGRAYEVVRVVVPAQRAAEPRRHDIALLQLAEPVPAEIAPMATSTEDVEPGTKFVLAGWGILARGDEGVALGPAAMAAPTRKLRAGWNVIERVEKEQGLLVSRFDDPDTAVELEAGPCIGDSGGPALVQVASDGDRPPTWRIAGVVAAIDDGDEDRIVGEYGEEFTLTSMAAYADWFRETIGE